jgi:hypothetical protein
MPFDRFAPDVVELMQRKSGDQAHAAGLGEYRPPEFLRETFGRSPSWRLDDLWPGGFPTFRARRGGITFMAPPVAAAAMAAAFSAVQSAAVSDAFERQRREMLRVMFGGSWADLWWRVAVGPPPVRPSSTRRTWGKASRKRGTRGR